MIFVCINRDVFLLLFVGCKDEKLRSGELLARRVFHIWWQRWDPFVAGERRGSTNLRETSHVRDEIGSDFQIKYGRWSRDGTG